MVRFFVMDHAMGNIIDILQSTLHQLEETSDLCHDHPAVLELRRDVLGTIAELKITKALLQLEKMADISQRQSEIRSDDEARAA
jgi:hypothetical protein